VTEH
jgi:putative transposase